MIHHSFRNGHPRPATLDELLEHVAPKLIEGAKAASKAFTQAGVRHVLVGGLAVGVNGYPRSTRDIDFLVADEAFDFHGPIVTPKAGLPIRYSGVEVDWVSLEPHERAAFDHFLVLPHEGEVPIIPVEPLVLMKLVAGRSKDHTDIVEMIKAGAEVERLRAFVHQFKPDLTENLEKLAEIARREA